MKKTLKKSVAVITALTLALIVCVFPLSESLALTADAAEITLNAEKVEIYTADDWALEKFSIPDEYPQSFQLKVTGAENVSFYTYDSIDVSESGLITPHVTNYYWYGSIGYSSPIQDKEPDRISSSINYGEKTVYVYADGNRFEVTVNVINYTDIYVEQIISDYLAENITADMTTREKLNKIGAFIAERPYDYRYQSVARMVLGDGGDCWSSTNTVVKMARMLGLEAWGRNGNKDPGAGSGHRNAMVYDGEKYYEVEAGYSSPAPRPYHVTERTSLFSAKYNSEYEGYMVYQYDGQTVPQKLTIPSEINGSPVVAVGDSFINLNSTLEEVVLPETIKSIGYSAFNSCYSLKKINIPKSVESIGMFAFTACDSLKEVSCESDSYSYINGALYKDDTVLVAVPNAASVKIPDTVTEIADYAFYYNDNIVSVTVPESVETIGEGAFGNCEKLTNVTLKDGKLTSIGDFAFAANGMTSVFIPASVTEIGENINYGHNEFTIIGYRGTAAEEAANSSENITFADAGNISAVLGDADGNGKVNIDDATYTQKMIAGIISADEKNSKVADVDFSGNVNIDDVTLIQKYVAGMISDFSKK